MKEIAILTALTMAAASAIAAPAEFQPSRPSDRPVAFTENRGQWDERVLFKANGDGGLTWWIERDGFTVLFSAPDTTAELIADPRSIGIPDEMPRFDMVERYPNKAHALKFKFQNALPHTASNFLPEQSSPASASSIESTERLSWNNNYFLGNNPSRWAPDCGNFQRVVLRDVWPGVDIQWRGVGKAVEFDFVVTPGADASQIRVEVLGLEDEVRAVREPPLRMDGGELLLPTSLGVLRQALPEAYQIEEDGSLSPVLAEFAVVGNRAFGVALPEGYDAGKPLVVDPLVYSTYLGGGGYDIATALVQDREGGVVVAGWTTSEDFLTTEGAYQRNLGAAYDGATDAFIARFNSEGSALIYSTYLGGDYRDEANAIILDRAGGVIVAGTTLSDNFPTTERAYQRHDGGDYAAFVTNINAEGNQLIYGAYFEGSRGVFATALASDGAGGVVVAGFTNGNIPTTEGAYDRSFNGGNFDVILARFSEDGSQLLYSTYLGGSDSEQAYAIVPDGVGGVFIAGLNRSHDFPTTEGAFDRSFNGGNWDCFIARLSEDGSELLYGTYLGGGHVDFPRALASDGAGGVVVAGYTSSQDFPTTEGTYQVRFGGYSDAFVSRLNAEGSSLIYSTYIGGDRSDCARALIPDGNGGMVVAGSTSSQNFQTTEGAYNRSYNGGGSDAFIARLSGDGSELLYSTYIGGSGDQYEEAYALAPDGVGGVVVAGYTNSSNFPTTERAYQRDSGGDFDAFIARIDIGLLFDGRWLSMLGAIAAWESNLVEFDIAGESLAEDAELTLTFSSPDLPESATFEDHGDGTGTFTWQTTYGDAGNYTAVFTLSDGEHEIIAEVPIEVKAVFYIPMRGGWDLISSVSQPEDPAMPSVWEDIVSRDRLIIAKDQQGNIYVPSQEFNNMPPWDACQGYYACVREPDTLFIAGEPVAEDTPIPLSEGWSMVAYFPEAPQTAPEAFVNLGETLLFAKNDDGRFYTPQYGFSNMRLLRRGKGYAVRVSEACDLVWNIPEGERLAMVEEPEDQPFRPALLTWRNMSVLVNVKASIPLEEGVQISALDENGVTVGVGTIRDSRCGLAVWGDDPETPEREGLREGETFWLEFNKMDRMGRIDRVDVVEGEGLVYATDGFTVVEAVVQSSIPTEYYLSEAYPNPFNATTRLTFGLPEAGWVHLSIFDLNGRLVKSLVAGELVAGVHSVQWNASNLSSGLYLARLESGGHSAMRKMMMVK